MPDTNTPSTPDAYQGFSPWGRILLSRMVLYPIDAHREIEERLQQQLTLPDELEAKTLFAASSTRMGKLDVAIDILSAIEPAIQELPNPALRSYYYSIRGSYWRNRGDFPKAIDDHQQSLTLGQEAQSPYSVARAYGNLAVCFQLMGKPANAIQASYRSLDLFYQLNKMDQVATLRGNLGILLNNIGEYNRAIEEFLIAVDLEDKYGNNIGKARHYTNLGSVYFDLRDYHNAYKYYSKALELQEDLPTTQNTDMKGNLARSLFKIGRQDDAMKLYAEVIADYRTQGRMGMLAQLLISTASGFRDLGDKQKARECLLECIEICRSGQQNGILASALHILADMERSITPPEERYELLLEAAEIVKDNKQKPESASTVFHALARCCMELGRYEEACEHFQVSIEAETQRSETEAKSRLVQLEAEDSINKIKKERDDIEAKNKELEELTRQLNETISERDTLMGMVSHDLRSPLGLIITMTEMLEVHPSDPDSASMKQQIIKTGWNMAEMVEKLLDLNKIRRNSLLVDITPCIPDDIINGTALPYQVKCRQKNIRLAVGTDPELPLVSADPVLAGRILDNLLSNAFKFTPPGGSVSVYAQQHNNTVVIYVSDTGPGIPLEEQSKLFVPFTKLSAKPTDGEPSSGLGLSIAASMAKKMNASVELVSSSSEGSTFSLCLPALPDQDIKMS